ncbi:hypothetical protein EZV62_028150 [Acer yangbiense]|uniref:Reverse transcriptase Ty1/copia-type domain-containing protein n=1 Tax=Acer yangbiense TaxID=1000413 RepID=A0A5C7GP72_9ROSI|nr:hypothetical protein EZV62_028150 [Acer yangbiense]
MSEKGLMVLAKKNLLSGMKNAPLKTCAHCLAGKQNSVAFKTSPPSRKPDLDPIPLTHVPVQVRDEVQDDQDGTVDADTHIEVEIDNDIHEQLPVPEVPPDVPLRRSTRDRQPSTRYYVDELKMQLSKAFAMKDLGHAKQILGIRIHRERNAKKSKHIDVRYHWIRDAINDKLFELEKIHTDHNGSDMLTKALPREKLEA